MEKEKWINKMNELDKKFGNYEPTLHLGRLDKRISRFEKFTGVSEDIIRYLEENGIRYNLCEVIKVKKWHSCMVSDFFLPEYNIIMRHTDCSSQEEQKNSLYYRSYNGKYYPIFIRKNESSEFVIMKIRNTIQKAKDKPKEGFTKVRYVYPAKRKRQRITAIKIERKRI